MSKRTIIGANRRTSVPGGFSTKRKCSTLYNDACVTKRAAMAFLENRGIPTFRDAFTVQQTIGAKSKVA